MLGFEFLGWEVVEGGVEPLGVVPADLLDDGAFDLVRVPPGPVVLDQLGLEGAVQGLGHGVVIRVRDGADRSSGAYVRQPFAVADRKILGEFNQSLQHRAVAASVAALRRPRRVSASRGSCGAGC